MVTKPINETGKLFRSLAADDSNSPVRARTAAREAEQRWPLLRNMAPTMPQAAPILTDVDKRHWHRQGAPTTSAAAPSLSVPDLKDKLALGLGRMGAPRPPTLAPGAGATVEDHPVPAPRFCRTASAQTALPAHGTHLHQPKPGVRDRSPAAAANRLAPKKEASEQSPGPSATLVEQPGRA